MNHQFERLKHDVRISFMDWFRSWYESRYGGFDVQDPEHDQRWVRLYVKMWYDTGLSDALYKLKDLSEKMNGGE